MNALIKHGAQRGYTLIELLLYISILGSLLFGVSLYFVTTTSARVKNQSIAEVDRQGTLALDYITQTIRNSTSITSPTVGSSASSLTLVVPTSSLSPTIFSLAGSGGTATLGYNQVGASTDSSDSNSINATKFVASVSGTTTTLYAHVGAVDPSPNNKAQMAIYTGTTSPTTLLASSAGKLLTANSWNTFTIASVSIASGQNYWLAYNSNGSSGFVNNLQVHTGTTGQSMFISQTYNSWPASWVGTPQDLEFSLYADVVTGASSGALQVKEGTASAIPFTNDKVQIGSLTLTNLSRSGTPGVVQVSFTVSRVNPANKNEYDYQKTFTASAALRP